MSRAYIGIYVMILTALLKALGIEVAEGQVQIFIEVAMTLVGAAIAASGRYRLGGIGLLGQRKTP